MLPVSKSASVVTSTHSIFECVALAALSTPVDLNTWVHTPSTVPSD